MHFYRVMVAGMVVVIGLCGVVSAQTAETTDTESTAAAPSETEAASASTASPALNATQLQRLSDLEAKPLHKFSNAELGEYLPLRQAGPAFKDKTPKPADEMIRMARKAIGQPYRLNSVRGDWGEGDCVTFTNRAIALSLAHDWASFHKLYERLIHKNGVVDYKNRNFVTLTDWLPDTAWLLKDVTGELGPVDARAAQPFTYYVRPKVFKDRTPPGSKYTRTAFLGVDKKSEPTEARNGLYIPREKVASIIKDLRPGDIFLVLRDIPKDPDCTHLGLISRVKNGEAYILHSASPKVIEEPIKELMERSPWLNGFIFLRLRDDAGKLVSDELNARMKDTVVPDSAQIDNKVGIMKANRERAQASK